MQVLEIRSLDGPDGLAAAERPDPDPDGRVVIDVRAAGVSFPDLLISQGRYQVKAELPWVPGQEVAGVVRSAPPGHVLRAGDRAWGSVDNGGFASVAAVAVERAYPLHDALSFEEGASLGVNFLTAVFALGRRAALKEGETVLVLGAAGGLGSATVSVAKAYGARVLAVVSTEEKVATARSAGADEVIAGADWRDRILELTGGRGVDVAADVVGGGETLQAVRSTAPEGRVLILGFTSGEIPAVAANRLLLRNVSLVGVGLGAFIPTEPDILVRTAGEVVRLVGAGLRPIVGATFPLAQGADALRALAARTAQGKLVLTV
ncbi:NADPH:quinone oxidoreductase family protein [Solirubrobacter ginsenosidimutans]|uniref:NADPH:quinone oxidoreductase family protein n=1 Tax=Solirubrobacter ginsenosidimutans TaxID=490573 RepID=A0A9X3MR27_9ACTN|nr:NADPH:quinone oxidoreductase family protein [Solirubrobacter ginsenosidimutans]MDA0160331.1 NADPH:quinone oxidoreductase family protein [Solirubrobacter ginsenosidimutans]